MRPTANQCVKTALANVGYKEAKGNKNKFAWYIDDHYPTFYNGRKNGTAWCDIYFDYCILYNAKSAKDAEYVLCQPSRSAGAGCKWSYQYYKAKGRTSKTGHFGDQVFLNSDTKKCSHTGMIYKVDAKYYYYVAGNDGNKVSKHKILKTSSKIYGFGRPRYK